MSQVRCLCAKSISGNELSLNIYKHPLLENNPQEFRTFCHEFWANKSILTPGTVPNSANHI